MKRVAGVRAVTFDCWGTLLKDRDWEGAMEIRLGALLRYVDKSPEDGRALLEEAWARHDEAWKQVETFGAGRMAAYCLERSGIFEDEAIAGLTEEFELASTTSGVEAVEGAETVLVALKEGGIRRGLVCDTGFTPGRVVRELLEQNGLLGYLECLCFSDEVGVPKPGNEIFAKCVAELGVHPREAIHIGDLKRTDIAGARDLGMSAVRFRGVHDDRSDAPDARVVIDRHEQLLELLGL